MTFNLFLKIEHTYSITNAFKYQACGNQTTITFTRDKVRKNQAVKHLQHEFIPKSRPVN